ncbi:MAG TPA: triple tyrosine motif-containing protein, partial [Salinimicrobium sp.]|nr:triple tyrosine motif-containing protein [Salinimicrobium sp.]
MPLEAQQAVTKLNGLSNIPRITHFSRNDFHGDPQFWAMTVNHEGIRFFGNNDGVLVFDGERWNKVRLPNNSSVRSLLTANNGKVYAAGYNEIGTIERDSLGKYKYSSLLKDLKLENDNLENLWQVHQLENFIIFRSFKELLVLLGGTVAHIPSNVSFLFANVVNGNYYVQDANHGIFEFDPVSMQLRLLFEASGYENKAIVGLLPDHSNKNIIIIATKSGQLFRANIETKKIEPWLSLFSESKTDEIITSIPYKKGYLFGTLSSKIICISSKGEIIEKPAILSNLSNSSVLNLYNEDGNIWALLNNGLDFIEFGSPVSVLFDKASVYDILIEPGSIYLATNKGVFYADMSDKNNTVRFKKIPNLNGQAWSVKKLNGSIVVGHDKGMFVIKNRVPKKIGNVDGFWKMIPIKDKPNLFLGANYHGLYLFSNKNNEWELLHKLKGFNESSRDILAAKKENTYWICHGYKGVFKIKINDEYSRIYALEHYTDQNGFRSPFNINVFNWNQDIVFTTNTGIYSYQEKKNIFKPYLPLNSILDTSFNTRKLLQYQDFTWAVQDDEIGYFKTADSLPELHKSLFLNLKGKLNRGMESIAPLNKDQVLIGATNGLYLYNIDKDISNKSQTKLTQISFSRGKIDSLLPINSKSAIIELQKEPELIRFEFSAPGLSVSSTNQYQYILTGIDTKWSEWNSKSFKEYTHLRPGDYIFKVRSRDLIGNTGQEASFSFSIPPVWYQTNLAIIIYILIFLGISLLIVKAVTNKMERERQKSRI